MLLDKLKVVLIVGIVLQALRVFLPDLPTPAEFQTQVNVLVDSLFVVIPVIAGWFKKESAVKIRELEKGP